MPLHNVASSVVGALKAATEKRGSPSPRPALLAANGEAMRDENGNRLHTADDDEVSQPLAQAKWFQAGAKAVRMSVMEHVQRDRERRRVNEQLKAWADQTVKAYSRVCRHCRPALPPCHAASAAFVLAHQARTLSRRPCFVAHMHTIVGPESGPGSCPTTCLTKARLFQEDLDQLELVDLEQLDSDGEGPIQPEGRGLASDMKRGWQQSIDDEVAARMADFEASLRKSVQARTLAFSAVRLLCSHACVRHSAPVLDSAIVLFGGYACTTGEGRVQFELDVAKDMRAGAEQLMQEVADANEVIAELQSHASRHQGTVDAARSQIQVRCTAQRVSFVEVALRTALRLAPGKTVCIDCARAPLVVQQLQQELQAAGRAAKAQADALQREHASALEAAVECARSERDALAAQAAAAPAANGASESIAVAALEQQCATLRANNEIKCVRAVVGCL